MPEDTFNNSPKSPISNSKSAPPPPPMPISPVVLPIAPTKSTESDISLTDRIKARQDNLQKPAVSVNKGAIVPSHDEQLKARIDEIQNKSSLSTAEKEAEERAARFQKKPETIVEQAEKPSTPPPAKVTFDARGVPLPPPLPPSTPTSLSNSPLQSRSTSRTGSTTSLNSVGTAPPQPTVTPEMLAEKLAKMRRSPSPQKRSASAPTTPTQAGTGNIFGPTVKANPPVQSTASPQAGKNGTAAKPAVPPKPTNGRPTISPPPVPDPSLKPKFFTPGTSGGKPAVAAKPSNIGQQPKKVSTPPHAPPAKPALLPKPNNTRFADKFRQGSKAVQNDRQK